MPCPQDVAFCTGCGFQRDAGQQVPPRQSAEDRRRISVLFIDLVGFTPYVEHSDPELVRELQTSFFATARQVISRYGGVVEKYIGDAVMALFGAPVATETDAVRCVRAGLELQRTLARFVPKGSERPHFRVGVATGEALVDVAAARDGGQAIVAGDVVNTASRIQSSAPPDGVLVCGTTYAATRTAVRYLEQPPVLLRGRSTPTEVWLALAPTGTVHRDSEATIPLVDRTHELGLLINALDRSLRERRPQLVTVLGHAGIGKSRLVRELYGHTERLFDEPVIWHTGRCPPFGENVTYAALAEIVKAHAGILDTDPAEVARSRLEASLRAMVDPEEAQRLLEALRPLVGLPTAKLSADESESAWRRFIVALAAQHPTVLVFEDLHWADDSMLRFVELLGASVREVPLLLLCTARPELVEREPTWSAGIGGTLRITLPPLRDAEIATMYAHLLGQAAFPGPRSARWWSWPTATRCTPTSTPGCSRSRVRSPGCSCWGSGRASPCRTASTRSSPTASTCSTRRTARCCRPRQSSAWSSGPARSPRRSACPSTRSTGRCAGYSSGTWSTNSPRRPWPSQPEYRFGHVLMRDVCYQRLPRTERIARHERTAEWLDAVSVDRNTDLAEVVAHHRYTAHEIARILGLDVTSVRGTGTGSPAPGGPAGVLPACPGHRRELRRTGPGPVRRLSGGDGRAVAPGTAGHGDRVLRRRGQLPVRRRQRATRGTGRSSGRRRRSRMRRAGVDPARAGGLAARGPAQRAGLRQPGSAPLPGPAGQRGESRRLRGTRTVAHAQLRVRTRRATRQRWRPRSRHGSA